MERAPVLAAGGIVLQRREVPLIAVVRLRKRSDWVLPKGKLNDGETPRAAAEREVLEETGHEVSVREFLGTLAYESRGRTKVVHFWRMEASGEQTYDLMNDVKAVAWLPLDKAVGRLTRGYERAFLANVGPLALEAAAATATPLIFPVRRSSTKRIAAGKSAQRKLLALKPLGRSMSELTLPASASATNMSGAQPIVESGIGKIMPITSQADVAKLESSLLVPEPDSHGNVVVSPPQGGRSSFLHQAWFWLRSRAWH